MSTVFLANRRQRPEPDRDSHRWRVRSSHMETLSYVAHFIRRLYGNIGLKIFYVNVVEGILHGPPLISRRGRWCWAVTVVLFWWTGFVIGAAIPQVQTLSGMVGAVSVGPELRAGRPLIFLTILTGDKHAIHLQLPDWLHLLVPRPTRCNCGRWALSACSSSN